MTEGRVDVGKNRKLENIFCGEQGNPARQFSCKSQAQIGGSWPRQGSSYSGFRLA